MASFVAKMAKDPIVKNDQYSNNWHLKYGASTSQFWDDKDKSLANSSLYTSKHRFPPVRDPYTSPSILP